MNPPALRHLPCLLFFAVAALPATTRADGVPTSPAADPAAAPTEFTLDAYRSLGAMMARESHLPELHWDAEKIAAFLAGVQSGFSGQTEPLSPQLPALHEQIDRSIATMQAERHHAELASKEGLKRFMKNLRKEAGLRESDSGLCYRVLKPGTGIHPRRDDEVVVSFECRTADDMTPVRAVRADHLRVKVGDLLPGLCEGVQMITDDGELLVVLPPDLSFRNGTWPQGLDPVRPLAFILKLHQISPRSGSAQAQAVAAR